MTGRQRLAMFSLALTLAAIVGMSSPRPATALDGCFNFKNSLPTPFSDDGAPGGISWYCAGSAPTDCQDCITDVDEGDGTGLSECVSDPDDTYCEQYY
jgi:hypothetical protein